MSKKANNKNDTVNVVSNRVYKRLLEKGIDHKSAIAILSNIERESGFNPTVYGDNGDSYGLFQFNKTYKNQFFEYAKNKGVSAGSPEAQVDFMLDVYMPSKGNNHVKNFLDDKKSVTDKADYFMRYFEVPAKKDDPAFIHSQKQRANKWLTKFGYNPEYIAPLPSDYYNPGGASPILQTPSRSYESTPHVNPFDFGKAFVGASIGLERALQNPTTAQQAATEDPLLLPSLLSDGVFRGQDENGNFFSQGGKMTFEDKLGTIGAGMSGILGASLANANISDTSNIQSQIDSTKNISPAEDNKSLIEQWGSISPLDANNIHVNGVGGLQGALTTAGGVFSGASAGASLGGVAGGIIGGLAGLAGGIGGMIIGNSKARREQERLRGLANQANSQMIDRFSNKALSIDYNNERQLMNTFAEGGSLTEINAGGTHEQNPYGGVPVGIGANGKPNMLEEGETVHNDYVFSNRIPIQPEHLKFLGINSKKPITFAEASKILQKDSKERPNDPISKRGEQDSMIKLQQLQELYKQQLSQAQNMNPAGGTPIMPNGQNVFAYGGGIDEYTFYNYSGDLAKDYALNYGTPYSSNTSTTTPTTTTSTNFFSMPDFMRKVSQGIHIPGLSESKATVGNNVNSTKMNPIPMPDNLRASLRPQDPSKINMQREHKVYQGSTVEDTYPRTSKLANLRYAPILGNAIGVASDLLGLTNKPDYSDIDSLKSAVKEYNYQHTPFGERAVYTPLDREYHANKLAAQASAGREAVLNSSQGNVGHALAGLVGNNYTSQLGLGNLYRQAAEHDNQHRMQVLQMNNALDGENAKMAMQAYHMNRGTDQLKLQAELNRIQMRDRAKAAASQARSANLTNLFNSIGDLGREAYSRNQIISNPSLLYYLNSLGEVNKKGTTKRKQP